VGAVVHIFREQICEVIEFFNEPNPPSCSVALRSTQPVTEISTRNLPEGKGWPAHKAYNLTTIFTLMV
jgi:predicted transcriptional regulator